MAAKEEKQKESRTKENHIPQQRTSLSFPDEGISVTIAVSGSVPPQLTNENDEALTMQQFNKLTNYLIIQCNVSYWPCHFSLTPVLLWSLPSLQNCFQTRSFTHPLCFSQKMK